jgi:phosphonate transport system substrate-binding protein
MKFLSEIGKISLRLALMVVITIILACGCGEDQDVKVVDFTIAVPVEQPKEKQSERPCLKVAVGAIISPEETFVYYRQLLDYIGEKLDSDIELVQRKTYEEINELLGVGKIDLAFICSGPYVSGKKKYGFDLVAVPQVEGSCLYQAYLIVNKKSSYHSLEDLRGGVFAFTDPESNTGALVPTYWLAQMGEKPDAFFSRTIHTFSHDNSILAVARGLVDGASVDGLVWEYYQYKKPELTSATRVIKKSESYGIPPVVAAKDLPQKMKEAIRQTLFSMNQDREGEKILKELRIDRFTMPQEEWHQKIQRIEQMRLSLSERTDVDTKP